MPSCFMTSGRSLTVWRLPLLVSILLSLSLASQNPGDAGASAQETEHYSLDEPEAQLAQHDGADYEEGDQMQEQYDEEEELQQVLWASMMAAAGVITIPEGAMTDPGSPSPAAHVFVTPVRGQQQAEPPAHEARFVIRPRPSAAIDPLVWSILQNYRQIFREHGGMKTLFETVRIAQDISRVTLKDYGLLEEIAPGYFRHLLVPALTTHCGPFLDFKIQEAECTESIAGLVEKWATRILESEIRPGEAVRTHDLFVLLFEPWVRDRHRGTGWLRDSMLQFPGGSAPHAASSSSSLGEQPVNLRTMDEDAAMRHALIATLYFQAAHMERGIAEGYPTQFNEDALTPARQFVVLPEIERVQRLENLAPHIASFFYGNNLPMVIPVSTENRRGRDGRPLPDAVREVALTTGLPLDLSLIATMILEDTSRREDLIVRSLAPNFRSLVQAGWLTEAEGMGLDLDAPLDPSEVTAELALPPREPGFSLLERSLPNRFSGLDQDVEESQLDDIGSFPLTQPSPPDAASEASLESEATVARSGPLRPEHLLEPPPRPMARYRRLPASQEFLAIAMGLTPAAFLRLKRHVSTIWREPDWIARSLSLMGQDFLIRVLVSDFNVHRQSLPAQCAHSGVDCITPLALLLARESNFGHFFNARAEVAENVKRLQNGFEGSPESYANRSFTESTILHMIARLLERQRDSAVTIDEMRMQDIFRVPIPQSSPSRSWADSSNIARHMKRAVHTADPLQINENEEDVFGRSVAYFEALSGPLPESFVCITRETGERDCSIDATTEWMGMVSASREMLFIRPFSSIAAWRFCGAYSKLCFASEFGMGVNFDTELIAALFNLEVVRQPVHEEELKGFYTAFYSAFHSPWLPRLGYSVTIRNGRELFLYGKSTNPPMYVSGLQIHAWGDVSGLRTEKYEWYDPSDPSRHEMRRQINIRRSHIVEDSLAAVATLNGRRFVVKFLGEEGVDAGGLTREYLATLGKKLLSPSFGLFDFDSTSGLLKLARSVRHNEFGRTAVEPYLHLVGFLLRTSLEEAQPLGCNFSDLFLMSLLGMRMPNNILASSDPALFDRLRGMVELGQDEQPTPAALTLRLDDKFEWSAALPYGQFFSWRLLDLDGEVQRIRDEADWRRAAHEEEEEAIRSATAPNCLRRGFFTGHVDRRFTLEEVRTGILGSDQYDVEDWRRHTRVKLRLASTPGSEDWDAENAKFQQAVNWFWEVLTEASPDDLGRFFLYWTGSGRLPADGFRSLSKPLVVVVYPADELQLFFQARTCFNELSVFVVDSKEKMQRIFMDTIYLKGRPAEVTAGKPEPEFPFTTL